TDAAGQRDVSHTFLGDSGPEELISLTEIGVR
ncbi:MAG: hypothetical protein UZ02_AOB001001231, partial [Nitrosomonas europaea]